MASKVGNPRVVGPGFWASWHIRTLKYTKKEDKILIKKIIEWDIFNFPCMECRGHAMEYLAGHPIVIDDKPHSLFQWTVDFHNTVNMRLGKDYIEYEDAKKLWSGENVCLEDCGDETPVDLSTTVKKGNKADYVYSTY